MAWSATMKAVAYRLPALDAETAERLNLVATRLKRGTVDFCGGSWRFSLAPLSGARPWPSDPFVVTLEWGGGRLHLLAGRAILRLLYAHRFAAAPLDVLPEDLALAAFRLAWRDAVGAIELLSGRHVRLVRAARAEPGALDGAVFRFALSLDSESARDGLTALVATDAPGLALLALLARRQPLESAKRDSQILVPLRLELGEMRLTVAALRELCVHNVLVPDTVIEAEAPTVWLCADSRHAARAKLNGHSLIIESIVEKKTTPQPQTPPQNEEADALAALDEVEVRLSFDLGEKTLRLDELAALQPGQVLELDAPTNRLVAIRANGRLVGRGELVRVADQVGVRVLELAAARKE
jgi:type III secretion protein Q